jgi:hypothetical protein
MKRIIFVTSHLYSGADLLYDTLNKHNRIQGFGLAKNHPYFHPVSLLNLLSYHHKLPNKAAWYMDKLLFNYQLTTSVAYKECKFVYLIREPRQTLNYMIIQGKFAAPYAIRYYLYRMRRICSMAAKTPGAVLLRWEDLNSSGMELIKEYLALPTPIESPLESEISALDTQFSSDMIGHSTMKEVEQAFEKYLYFLRSQDLKYV